VAVDYKAGLWSFDRYFTSFGISGYQLGGDSLNLRENYAVNRTTRLTFQMTGEEVKRVVIDSMKLQNTEAQTNYYFFQAPRLLVPLPKRSVTYGNTWLDRRIDTIHIHDTINIGVTDGRYIYDVSRTYRLDRLLDTMGLNLAVIIAVDSGGFDGYQSNSVTNVSLTSSGPLTGADTTYLDLFSGRVVLRTSTLAIPVLVTVSQAQSFQDYLEVRSVAALDESNATRIRSADEQRSSPPEVETPKKDQ
jgi:hypothetical protein